MKLKILSSVLVLLTMTISLVTAKQKNDFQNPPREMVKTDSVLRHVVLFKFKDGTTTKEIESVEAAFSALPSKIKQIKSYEWGINNSPEGLDKGFTHCFFLTFENEADRDTYLPHPDHKAFGEILSPYLEDVLVLDYWTK